MHTPGLYDTRPIDMHLGRPVQIGDSAFCKKRAADDNGHKALCPLSRHVWPGIMLGDGRA